MISFISVPTQAVRGYIGSIADSVETQLPGTIFTPMGGPKSHAVTRKRIPVERQDHDHALYGHRLMDCSKSCNWLTEQLGGLPLVSYPFDLEALPTNGICISPGAKK